MMFYIIIGYDTYPGCTTPDRSVCTFPYNMQIGLNLNASGRTTRTAISTAASGLSPINFPIELHKYTFRLAIRKRPT